MSAVSPASVPEDAAALEAAGAHHARLTGEPAGRVAMLLTAAERDPEAAEEIRAGLVALCEREILPHAAAEEAVLSPVARRLPDSRLLVESLVADHSCLTALVDALRAAATPIGAVADARALQVLFAEHAARETSLVLPLLALAPDVRLAALWEEVRDRSVRHAPVGGPAAARAAGTPAARYGCAGGEQRPRR